MVFHINRFYVSCGCFSEDVMKELQNVTLSDITVIATLGVGGFGRVELVISSEIVELPTIQRALLPTIQRATELN